MHRVSGSQQHTLLIALLLTTSHSEGYSQSVRLVWYACCGLNSVERETLGLCCNMSTILGPVHYLAPESSTPSEPLHHLNACFLIIIALCCLYLLMPRAHSYHRWLARTVAVLLFCLFQISLVLCCFMVSRFLLTILLNTN